jgi:hypothetical protein
MVRSSPRIMDPLFFAQASLPAVVFSLDAAVACGLQIRHCLRSSLPQLWSLSSSSIHRCSVSCVTGSICFFDRLGSHASSARITWLLQLGSGLFVLLDLICSDQLKKEKERRRESYSSCLLLVVLGDSSLSLYIATQRTVGYSKKMLTPLLSLHFHHYRCCSCTLTITMGYSLTSLGSVPVLCCLVLFDGTNYHDWIPRMHGL